MTTSPVLSDPKTLIASLPYLLGFEPRESAVVVWLRDRRILLTQRLDLPRDPHDRAWHQVLWSHDAAAVADQIVIVLVTEGPRPHEIADPILDRAASRGVEVLDLLLSREGRWRSLLCTDAGCCPEAGRLIDAETRTRVAAEFAWAGIAPEAAREEVVRLLARDEDLATAVAAVVAQRTGPGPRDREEWRDASIDRLLALLSAPTATIDPVAMADAMTALGDVRIRDSVLWTASHWRGERLLAALETLSQLVRCAPCGCLPPVGTLYAALAWLAGDGARAGIVLERVLAEDSSYSLARIIGTAVGGGLDPAGWRAALHDLSYAECRYGAA